MFDNCRCFAIWHRNTPWKTRIRIYDTKEYLFATINFERVQGYDFTWEPPLIEFFRLLLVGARVFDTFDAGSCNFTNLHYHVAPIVIAFRLQNHRVLARVCRMKDANNPFSRRQRDTDFLMKYKQVV